MKMQLLIPKELPKNQRDILDIYILYIQHILI